MSFLGTIFIGVDGNEWHLIILLSVLALLFVDNFFLLLMNLWRIFEGFPILSNLRFLGQLKVHIVLYYQLVRAF